MIFVFVLSGEAYVRTPYGIRVVRFFREYFFCTRKGFKTQSLRSSIITHNLLNRLLNTANKMVHVIFILTTIVVQALVLFKILTDTSTIKFTNLAGRVDHPFLRVQSYSHSENLLDENDAFFAFGGRNIEEDILNDEESSVDAPHAGLAFINFLSSSSPAQTFQDDNDTYDSYEAEDAMQYTSSTLKRYLQHTPSIGDSEIEEVSEEDNLPPLDYLEGANRFFEDESPENTDNLLLPLTYVLTENVFWDRK